MEKKVLVLDKELLTVDTVEEIDVKLDGGSSVLTCPTTPLWLSRQHCTSLTDDGE